MYRQSVNRLLGGAAVVVLSAGLGAGGSAAGSPAGRLLVVAVHDHESGGVNYPSDVLVVDADGRHLRRLTHDNAANGPAEWMPDGRRIIFQSHPGNTDRGAAHIYVINTDGTGRRRLTSASGGALPDVSPDGRRIAFLIVRPKEWPDSREWGVYVMDASGRHQRRLVGGRGVPPSGPSWSPDGRMLMFVSASRTADSLFVINGDGTGLTRLERKANLDAAAWAPRGRTLAIEHFDTDSDSLTIADLHRHLGRPVLRPVNKIRQIWPGAYEWSPDGRSIIYQNDVGVWVVDARGQARRRRFAVQALPRTWSPDRHWMVFASFRQRFIQVATASGRERRVLTRKIENCCPIDEIEWAPR